MHDLEAPLSSGPAMRCAATTTTRTAVETAQLAQRVAPWLRAGDALCLAGDLGAGKTTLVAALVAALGGDAIAVSPTFTLENRYALSFARPSTARPGSAPVQVAHFDLYRTDGKRDTELLGMMLEAREEGAILCVEWGASVEADLAPCLRIALTVQTAAARGHTDPPRRVDLYAIDAPAELIDPLRRVWAAVEGASR